MDAYKEYEQKQLTVYSYITKKQGATNAPCFYSLFSRSTPNCQKHISISFIGV